tara:strand:+ start:766 stop:1191 length:426 start_codon:yes stop_codon:yes gene_type:complete
MNETTNETAANNTADDTNTTVDIVAAVEESGLLEEPMVLALLACVGALVAFVCYTNPAIKAAVMPILNKYLKKYDAQINALLEENLTKAQKVAYEKLDETLQAQVKDELLRNVVLTAWDEKDDELKSLVKGKVKDALANTK